jgi:hypothetical protein
VHFFLGFVLPGFMHWVSFLVIPAGPICHPK